VKSEEDVAVSDTALLTARTGSERRRAPDRRRSVRRAHDVPPGATLMLAVAGGDLPDDSDLHGAVVRDFEIGKFPVLKEEYDWIRVWGMDKGYHLSPGRAAGNSHPVTEVSWYDAVKWCNAKSEHELLVPVYTINGEIYRHGEYGPDGSRLVARNERSNGYRLPAEAEWEWAARGGPFSRGHQFSGSDSADEVSWHEANTGGKPRPVGLKAANELGIHDMSGNVWEWCWDLDETMPANRLRGGSWGHRAADGTVTYRVSRAPDSRYSVIGFRLARNS
jgi:formylglycine-generating enzyme required for sulfatase activity